MTAVESVEKQKVKCDEPAERTPVAAETDLSINQPKKEEVCTATSLPVMTIMDTADASKPALSDAAIKTANQDITSALNPGWFGSVRFDQIKNSVIAMNASDMQRLERSFDKPGESGALRKMLQEKLDPAQFREVEALLDRKNGKPNLIGNIATAIEVSNRGSVESGETAGRMLRSTVGILTGEQLAALKKDWNESKYAKQYGNFDEAIQKGGFNPSDKQLMQGVFSKGLEQRTPEDIAAAARLVVNNYNKTEIDSSNADKYLRQLSDVLAGDSPAAVAARKALQGDKEFTAAYDKAFGPGTWANDTQKRVAQDLLSEGRISLSTIVSGNAKTLGGFFDNPDLITGALSRATPKEIADFKAGRALAAENRDAGKLTSEQRDQLAYFKKLDETFRSKGGERQADAWTEQLMNGKKGLISDAAATHSDGGLFGIGAGHRSQDLFKVFENMTPDQWKQLKDPAYMKDLKASVFKYATEQERPILERILDGKAKAPNFEASQQVKRTFAEVVTDAASSPEGKQAITDRLLTMTEKEAQDLKNNPALIKQTADVLNQSTGIDDKALAATVLSQSLLKQIEQTGKPVQQLTPVQQFAKDTMDGKLDTPNKKIDAVEKLVLGDPALRARLNEIQNMRDKGTLSADFKLSEEDINLSGLLMGSTSQFGYRNLLRGEQIGIGEKIAAGGGVLGDGFQGRYPDIAKIQPESERNRIVGMLSPEQQKIVQNVIKQGGATDLADEAQSYLVGDGGNYRDFVQKIAKMNDTDRANFFKTFESKYGQDFKTAFVNGSVKQEGLSAEYKTVLDKVAGQNFKPTLADEMRLKVLDGKTNPYQQFEDRLKLMTPVQIQQLKTEYAEKYGSALDKDFLGQVDNAGAKITFERMLKGAPTDPVSEFLERTATMDLTGANYDGTQINMERALQVNRDMIAQYQVNREKLPPELRDRIDKYFTEATQHNLDSKERLAKAKELALDIAVVTAAAASMYATFGLSAPVAGGVIASTGFAASVARPFIMEDTLGSKTITPEEFRQHAIRGGIDAALFLPIGSVGRGVEILNKIRTGDRAAETVNALVRAEQVLPAALKVEQALPAAAKIEEVVAAGSRVEPVIAAGARVEEVVVAGTKVEKIVPKVIEEAAPVVTVAKAEKLAPQVIEEAAPVVTVAKAEKLAPQVIEEAAPVVTVAKGERLAPVVVEEAAVVREVAPVMVRASNDAAVVAERQALALSASKGDQAAISALKAEDRVMLAKLAESSDPVAVKALQTFDRNQLVAAVARGDKTAAELAAFDRQILEKAVAAGDKQAIAKLAELDRAPLAKAAETGDAAAVKALQEFDRKVLAEAVARGDKTAAELIAFDRQVLEKAVARGDDGAAAALKAFDRKVLEEAALRGDARAIETLAAIRRSEAAARVVSTGLLGAEAAMKLGVPALAVDSRLDAAAELPKPVDKPLVPSAKLLELATVRRGEGPWQSAERILAADGKKHSVDEVRALTKAIQAAYKLDNNGSADMSGLKVKYSFAGTSANTFANIVANCKDDKVKALLLSLANS